MTATKTTKKTKAGTARKKAPASKIEAVQLNGKLGIQGVGELKEKLVAALSSGKPVSIDAGSVESADTAVLQLLAAFTRYSEKQSGEVKWVSTSAAFVASARLLDLDKHLGLEPAPA